MSSAQFSPAWWNEQAQSIGQLNKAAIENLTGMTFATVWNKADGTVERFWYNDVIQRAPGFADAQLQLGTAMQPQGFDILTAIGDANYPSWQYFVSPVGFVAPGATAPYQPVLSGDAPNFPPPAISGPIPPTPTTTGIDGPSSVQPPIVTNVVPGDMTPGMTEPPTLTVIGTKGTKPATVFNASSGAGTPASVATTAEAEAAATAERKRNQMVLIAAVVLLVIGVAIYSSRK